MLNCADHQAGAGSAQSNRIRLGATAGKDEIAMGRTRQTANLGAGLLTIRRAVRPGP